MLMLLGTEFLGFKILLLYKRVICLFTAQEPVVRELHRVDMERCSNLRLSAVRLRGGVRGLQTSD